jgi:hypothetical protein
MLKIYVAIVEALKKKNGRNSVYNQNWWKN